MDDSQTADEGQLNRCFCYIRPTVDADWVPLPTKQDSCPPRFLNSIPDLKWTPPEILNSPLELKDATDRIESEESRINPPEKIDVLHKMRDGVYEDKTVSFHWNLNKIVETKFKRIGSTSTPSPDQLPGVDEDSSADPRSNHRYELNTFVVVRTGGTEHDLDLWLGQVVHTHQASSEVVSELTVRWFEFYQSSDN